MICPYFKKCGGCSTQHLPYNVQLANKQRILEQILTHHNISIPVETFFSEPFHYRNRMDFIFCNEGLGLRAMGDWKTIIPVKSCPIANEGINILLKEVDEWFTKSLDVFNVKTKKGTLRYCVIRSTELGESSLSFVLNENSSKLKETIELIKAFSEKTTATNVLVTYVPAGTDSSISEEYFVVKGSELLTERIADKQFSFNVQGFFQNNTYMAELMVQYVQEHIEEQENLLDLYGGVGVFGISLAEQFKNIMILESFSESKPVTEQNAQKNGVFATVVADDAKNVHKLSLKNFSAITDPPRSGMHPKAIERLIAMQPKNIVYVSCNPQQLEKELYTFLKYYSISKAAIFDLFPQTNHVEVVVVMKKK